MLAALLGVEQEGIDFVHEGLQRLGASRIRFENDPAFCVDQKVLRRSADLIVLLRPLLVCPEGNKIIAIALHERKNQRILRGMNVDREDDKVLAAKPVESLLQVGKLPTAGPSPRVPEVKQHDLPAKVGQ